MKRGTDRQIKDVVARMRRAAAIERGGILESIILVIVLLTSYKLAGVMGQQRSWRERREDRGHLQTTYIIHRIANAHTPCLQQNIQAAAVAGEVVPLSILRWSLLCLTPLDLKITTAEDGIGQLLKVFDFFERIVIVPFKIGSSATAPTAIQRFHSATSHQN